MRPLGSTIQLQPGSFRRAARAARTCPAIRHSAASRRAAIQPPSRYQATATVPSTIATRGATICGRASSHSAPSAAGSIRKGSTTVAREPIRSFMPAPLVDSPATIEIPG